MTGNLFAALNFLFFLKKFPLKRSGAINSNHLNIVKANQKPGEIAR